MTDLSRVTIAVLLSLTPLLAAPGACHPIQPPPEPPGPATGGSTATGGSPGTGGAGTGGGSATGGTAGSGGAPATEEEIVCGHLRTIGCPEGSRPTCAAELYRINHLDDRASIDLECLLLSDTAAKARGCHSIACEGLQ